jgi:hypothetical protein
MSYGFGYGSLRSPAKLILRLAEPSPFVLSSSVGTLPSDGALVIIVQNIRRGGRLRHQVVAMGVANTSTRPVSLAAPGYGEGPEHYSNYVPTMASSQWQLRQ